MTTVTMLAPVGTSGIVQTAHGNTYTISANGQISGVATTDVLSLMGAGFTVLPGGGVPKQIPISDLRNIDGTVLTASASSGKFGLVISPGTHDHLVTEAANGTTITDSCYLETTVPATYDSGDTLIFTANGNVVIGSGTLSTKSLTCHAYQVTPGETISADLCNVVATFGTADADIPFVITPGTVVLNPGDKLQIELTATLIETSTHSVTGVLGGFRLG